jgi:exopolysaccharide biosynthesis polyprenyl glycosylphosphotransferase
MAVTTEGKSAALDLAGVGPIRVPVRYSASWTIVLLATDLIMFLFAAYVAGSIADKNWAINHALSRFLHSSIVFIVVWIVIFSILGLYERSLALSYRDEFYFTVVALALGVAPQLIVFTIVPSWSTSRLGLLLSAAVAMVLVGASRATIHFVRATTRSTLPSRILIVGSQAETTEVRDNLMHSRGGEVETILCDAGSTVAGKPVAAVAAARWLFDMTTKLGCNNVIFTNLQDQQQMRQFLALCEASEIKVGLALPSTPVGTYGLDVERIGNQDLLTPIRPRIRQPIARLFKRLFDLVFAAAAAILSAPVMLVAAIAIFIESGRPIFFRQERVGTFGRVFRIIKFRTMKINNDDEWAKPGDRRITRVGALLRRTSIDELPQLFNVLRGDMSLVGPRPEMRSFEEAFASSIPGYVERRLTKPGITGWAQINTRRNLSPQDIERVLEFDLFYIRHWSLFLDLTVLLKTAAEFLFHQGV